MMEYSVKCGMKSIPNAFWGETWLAFIFDGFSSREFAFVNPIHQLPWAMALICYFSNLRVEEGSFSVFHDFLESFPIVQTS